MRALLTYTYPFGAMPDDTAEYMLGDVAVNVVLMESDPSIWPYDNNPTSDPVHPGRNYVAENWAEIGTGINSIPAIKTKIEESLEWWKDTLYAAFPNAPADLLNFHVNWEHLFEPIHTGYEPIARVSDDFSGDFIVSSAITSVSSANQFSGNAGLSSIDDFYNGADIYFTSGALNGKHGVVIDYAGATKTFTFAPGTFSAAPAVGDAFGLGKGWMYDFLNQVGFNATGNFSSDVRAYNNFTRQQANADWAFTIFVVNNANDADKLFASGGSVRQAFSYPGGRFMIVPANREAKTFAHETGHQFWGLDEYLGGASYADERGYYNTPNLNAADNPEFGTDEVQSISRFVGTVSDGSFSLTLNLAGGISFSTQDIPYDATAPSIQLAINLAANGVVPGWANGDISVTGGPLTTAAVNLNFRGNSVRGADHELTVVNGSQLEGGSSGGVLATRNGSAGTAQQQNSIMAGDVTYVATPPDPAPPSRRYFTDAYNSNTSSPYTLAMIGWQDTDTAFGGVAGNGIFDVLDVPFTLSGFGQYKSTSSSGGVYEFRGSTKVNTLPNMNSEGNQSDITINQIRVVEGSVDGGPWQALTAFPERTYSTEVIVSIPVTAGLHEIRIRSGDTRTGVTSNVFAGETDSPTQDSGAGVGGVVFIDANTSAGYDTGEPLRPDVGLEVRDLNDVPLELRHEIEPNDYNEQTVLNGVDPGVTLSAIGAGKGTGSVYAYRSPTNANNLVFSGKFQILPGSTPTWLNSWNVSQQFKAKFSSPVSTVTLRFGGNSASISSFGRLEAYTADGTLVGRANTGPLTNGAFTPVTISRLQGDIAYVLAYGRLGTYVVLDTLSWGPSASTTTNSNGVYSLDFLPDGTYRVALTPPDGYVVTTPAAGYATISVAGGRTQRSVNFGISNSGTFYRFHNYTNQYNVDNDPGNYVAPNDALTIINYINAFSEAEGEIAPEHDPNVFGFIDVNGDGFCAPDDALLVINWINSLPAQEPEAPATSGTGGQGDGGTGEGEYTVEVPRNAAEYYAQNPLHLLNIPGSDEPCNCAACLQAATDEILSTSSPVAANEWTPAGSRALESLLASSGEKREIVPAGESKIAWSAGSLSTTRSRLKSTPIGRARPADEPADLVEKRKHETDHVDDEGEQSGEEDNRL